MSEAIDLLTKLVPLSVSVIGLAVSIAAFRKSSQTAKVNIPVPVVRLASAKWVEVAMLDGAERRFGIVEIRSKHPLLRLHAKVVSDEDGNHPNYEAEEGVQPTTRILCNLPTSVVIFHHPFVMGTVVSVKVKSRGDDALASWFELPIF